MRTALAAMALVALLGTPALAEPQPLSVEDCVKQGLAGSAELAGTEAKLQGFKARLAEVEALYGPRLSALAFVAPTFTVEGSGDEATVRRAYGLSDWGPYTRLEATLALPLYSFGRIEAGEKAALARLKAEEARAEATRAAIALTIRKLYYQRLYALSLAPTLSLADAQLATARARADRLFEEGTGEITQVELSRLTLAQLELAKATRQAQAGAELALAALQHTMGETAPITLAEERLPPMGEAPPPLALCLTRAAARPEWRALDQGATAAKALARAESLAWVPIFGLAGNLQAGYAPTRDDSPNPYHHDPYNELIGGVGVGLSWQVNPFEVSAKEAQALAQGAEVEALRRFAETGIPLEVKLAHQALTQAQADVTDGSLKVEAARAWLSSSSRAFELGSGDAKTLLEGLGAYVMAKKSHADALLAWHWAHAELNRAMGAP